MGHETPQTPPGGSCDLIPQKKTGFVFKLGRLLQQNKGVIIGTRDTNRHIEMPNLFQYFGEHHVFCVSMSAVT